MQMLNASFPQLHNLEEHAPGFYDSHPNTLFIMMKELCDFKGKDMLC